MPQELNVNKFAAKADRAIRALIAKTKQLEKGHVVLSQHLDAYEQYVTKSVIRPESAVPALVRDQKTSRLYVNKLKDYVKPIRLRTTTGQTTITVLANSRNTVSFVVPPEDNAVGDMEVYSLLCAAATHMNWRCMVYHTGAQRYLMNKPVHGSLVFADMDPARVFNAQPIDLYESIYLEPNNELRVEITNYDSVDCVIELAVEGRRFWAFDIEGLTRESLVDMFYSRLSFPYWLTQDSVTTIGTTTTPFAYSNTMTVEKGFDLEVIDVCRVESQSNKVVNGYTNYHTQINESASGRLIFDNIRATCFGGSGQWPLRFKETWLVKRGTPIQANYTNDAGISTVIDHVFRGRALPYSLPGQRTLTPVDPNVAGNQSDFPIRAQDLAVARQIATR